MTDAQRYRLDRRIATGGMGVVWAATDTLLEREVAVKVLKAEYADDADFRQRFAAEARNAAALQHPHVAGVLDVPEGTVASRLARARAALREALRAPGRVERR